MGMAYNPDQRANDFQVEYKINATGDRWFIPYNDSATTAAQLAQCKNQVGKTTNGSTEAGVENVV